MKKHYAIIVLADGETWQTIGNQSILVIDEDQFRDLADGRIDANDLKPSIEIGLQDYTPYHGA